MSRNKLLDLTFGSLCTVLSVRLRTNLICFSIFPERCCTGPKYSLRSSLRIENQSLTVMSQVPTDGGSNSGDVTKGESIVDSQLSPKADFISQIPNAVDIA